MKKPQDSDIFGTKSIGYTPRIQNNEVVDPNINFRMKMQAQYDAYTKKLSNPNRFTSNTGNNIQLTKVNENVQFDQNYHHSRKDADLQSSIFYEPTYNINNSRVNNERAKITQRHIPKHAYNQEYNQVQDSQINHGKKQILNREIKRMPENTTQFKGNSSNIFGYDQHVERNGVKNKIDKLIPHQMQWMEHDSIRHQIIDNGFKRSENVNVGSEKKLEDVQLSQSKMFTKEEAQKNSRNIIQSKSLKKIEYKNSQANIENNSMLINTIKQNKQKLLKGQPGPVSTKVKVSSNPQEKVKQLQKRISGSVSNLKKVQEKLQNKVEITVLKGWSSNIVEQLSKYCRINATKIISMNFQDSGKGSLIIEKSKRWENITDWLRKDGKLKIRVIN